MIPKFVFLLELSDQRIRTVDALTRLMGERPLVAVPYIVIDEEVGKQRQTMRWMLMASIIGFLVLVGAVHFLFMPLDILAFKIMTRLG